MKRFIENENDWDWNQVDYLQRQAWLHGMRTQRELALERVLAGDISLQHALAEHREAEMADRGPGGEADAFRSGGFSETGRRESVPALKGILKILATPV